MIHAVNLGDNTERSVQPEEVKALNNSNVWLELVDPAENELQAVSDATYVPANFLRLPKTEGFVNLRSEQGFGIINFPVMQDVTSTKKAYPVVMAFSKNFLVTVSKKETQPITDTKRLD
jgi:Mg2+ and Co2+ transporter CorA